MACSELVAAISTSLVDNPVGWIGLAVAIVSVTTALVQYRSNLARATSADYLSAAINQFERAHAAFLEKKSPVPSWRGLPEPDRLLWLTVARMLRTGDFLGARITEESHKQVFKNARSYWRVKMHDLLRELGAVDLSYFAETAESVISTSGRARSVLAEKSLKVIVDFLDWPAGERDALDGVENFTEEEIERRKSFGPSALGWYVEAANAIRRGPPERRAHWRKEWPKHPG